jgi:DNA-binding MarR family transcriptional regulator
VLVVRWFLDGTRISQLAADNTISPKTVYRYLHEGIDLAAHAPDLAEVLERAKAAGLSHVNLDGVVIPTDRVRAPGPTARTDVSAVVLVFFRPPQRTTSSPAACPRRRGAGPPGPPGRAPGVWVRDAGRRPRRRIGQRTGPQARLSKQAAGKTVGRLQELGYAERVEDPVDGRRKLVRLTTRGIDALAQSAIIFDKLRAEWADTLGADRLADLEDALRTAIGSTELGVDTVSWFGT